MDGQQLQYFLSALFQPVNHGKQIAEITDAPVFVRTKRKDGNGGSGRFSRFGLPGVPDFHKLLRNGTKPNLMTAPFPASDTAVLSDKVAVNKYTFLLKRQFERPISSGLISHQLCLSVTQPGCFFLRSAKKQLLSRIGLVMNAKSDGHDRKATTVRTVKEWY